MSWRAPIPGGLLGTARAIVLWERVWVRLWPALSVAGLFAALALFDVLPALGGWGHFGVVAGFGVLIATLLTHGFSGLKLPSPAEGRARLEWDSGLAHRPFDTLADDLAAGNGDAKAEALWRVHRQRAAKALQRLRLKWPRPGVARHDPRALRAAVAVLLTGALVAGGSEAGERFGRALSPSLSPPPADRTIDLWITPPTYTGRATRHLTQDSRSPDPTMVPEGSTVLAQVGGSDEVPWLKAGDRRVSLTEIGPGAHRGEMVIGHGDRIAIGLDEREIAAWPVTVVPDRAPTVAFSAPPKATPRGRLTLAYEARDDYGVSDVLLVVARNGEKEPLRITLPLPLRRQAFHASSRQAFHASSRQDLSAHSWAGLPVRLSVEAVDAAGKTGRGGWVDMVLPERSFAHPVARAIVALRKRLVDPTPAVRGRVADGLAAIAVDPGSYEGSVVVHLALRVASNRLLLDETASQAASVRDILWRIALRLEEGRFAEAERRLSDLGQELQRALEAGAEPEAAKRLAQALKQALDSYLPSLMKELQRRGLADLSLDTSGQVPGSDLLRRLVDEIRELVADGDLDDAREKLAQLRSLLDTMGAAMQQRVDPERLAKASSAMNRLRDIERRQKNLMDETFRRLRESSPGQGRETGGSDPPGPARGSAEQEELRRDLNRLMDETADLVERIPGSLRKAEGAMAQARSLLDAGSPDEAVQAQGQALDQLHRALEQISTALDRNMPGLFGRRGFPLRGRDPFGRMPSGGFGTAVGGSAEVPKTAGRHRVRAILDELRRRAGDPTRPEIERDYIQRLLRQF